MASPTPLTAEKLWPVVLSLGEKQMKSLFYFLMDYLYPWPEEKLIKAHQDIQKNKILTEEQFQSRFSDYISSQD